MSVEYRPSFLGTGSAHPEKSTTNEMVGEFVANYSRTELKQRSLPEDRISKILEVRKRAVAEIAEMIGIENRYWCSGNESASTIGVEAGHNALEASGVQANEIKGVILSTGLGDYLGTATAAIIAKELGIPEKVMTHDISAACTGFAHAIYEACTNLTSPMGLDGPILVVSSETISRGMHPSKKGTVPIFGDGAGAVVVGVVEVENNQPWPLFTWGANAEHIKQLYIPVGGSVEPITPQTPDEKRGVVMDNKFIFQIAREKMVEAGKDIAQEAEEFKGKLEWLDWKDPKLIPHQANLLIMEEVQHELGFNDEDVVVNISQWANTGSAAIPIALDEAIRQGRLTDKDSFIGVVFGSGLLWAGFIIHLYGLQKKWAHYPGNLKASVAPLKSGT